MDKTANSIPANLIYVSDRELFTVALIAAVVVTASYMIDKERQRKFVEKYLKTEK